MIIKPEKSLILELPSLFPLVINQYKQSIPQSKAEIETKV